MSKKQRQFLQLMPHLKHANFCKNFENLNSLVAQPKNLKPQTKAKFSYFFHAEAGIVLKFGAKMSLFFYQNFLIKKCS